MSGSGADSLYQPGVTTGSVRGQAPRGSRLCLGHSRRGFVAGLGVAAVLAVAVAIVVGDIGLVRGGITNYSSCYGNP